MDIFFYIYFDTDLKINAKHTPPALLPNTSSTILGRGDHRVFNFFKENFQ